MMFFKFLIELLALLLLFLLFRQAVLKTFPVKALGMPLSEQSARALRHFRNRYIILLVSFSTFFTWLVSIALRYTFMKFHQRNEALALIVDNVALLLPSLIFGLLVGTYVARWANHKLQKDGLSFFFEGYTDELEGFDRQRITKWQVGLSVFFGLLLILGQYNYRIKVQRGNMSVKTGVFERAREYSLADVQVIKDSSNLNNYIFLLPDDTLTTNDFGGDKEAVVQAIEMAKHQ